MCEGLFASQGPAAARISASAEAVAGGGLRNNSLHVLELRDSLAGIDAGDGGANAGSELRGIHGAADDDSHGSGPSRGSR